MKLSEIFAKYDKLTIAKLSEATNINYALLLKKSKEPIPGVAYDPESKNFTAMDALMEKRKVDLDKIDWEKLNSEAQAKSTSTVKEAVWKVGDKYYLRYFKANFEVVYMTAEYVCILQEGLTQPKVLANNTFIACGLKPYEAPAKAEAPVEEQAPVVEETEATETPAEGESVKAKASKSSRK